MKKLPVLILAALISDAAMAQSRAPGEPQTVEVASGSLRLKALLWKPAGRGPVPAVLFNHGRSTDPQTHYRQVTITEADGNDDVAIDNNSLRLPHFPHETKPAKNVGVGEHLKHQAKASLTSKHRAAFLALRPLVQGALASGYTVKATWATLRADGRISMTYETFRLHCRRAGLGRAPPENGRVNHRIQGAEGALSASGGPPRAIDPPQKRSYERPPGFHHERVPRKNEIYG